MRSDVGLLVMKELRQMSRSRRALLSALLVPTFMLVILPAIQLRASSSGRSTAIPHGAPVGLSALGGPKTNVFLYFVFPLLYVLAGLMTPSVAAIYTIINERERRTLELLMALPVTVRQILAAKLIANLIGAVAPMLPLFLVNAALVLTVGRGTPAYLLAALVLLLSALASTVGLGLFLALVVRDYRSAQSLTYVWILPAMLLVGAADVLVPGLWRFYALAAVLLLLLVALLAFCLKWLTFERYLA